MTGRARERLRDRPAFVRFWTATTVSSFGSAITGLALQVLVVKTLHEGAGGVGLLKAAQTLPYLLFGLVVGVQVDRVRRLPLLISTDLVRGALLIIVPALALTGHLTLTLLMVVMAIFGLLSLINMAATQSFTPRLVPADLLAHANARLDQSDGVAQTSGPALAGLLVAMITAPWAVVIDAVSYLFSGLFLVRIEVDEPAPRRISLRGLKSELAEGLRWIYGHRTLRPYAIGTYGWFLFSAMSGAVLAPFVLNSLHMSAFGYGVVLTVAGIGGLVGSLAATRLGMRFGAGRVVIATNAGTGLAWAIMALSPRSWGGWVVLGLGQLVLGVSMGASNPNELGYRQRITPDHLQGRMNATMHSTNRAFIVVGAPLGGFLGDAVGLRPMLWVSVVGFFAVAIGMAGTPFRSARLDDPVT